MTAVRRRGVLGIAVALALLAAPAAHAANFTVTTTDDAGRSPSTVDTAFTGASRNGDCRVFLNNTTPVTNDELYDQAFNRLDAIVQRAGGIEALVANPENIPQVHIRADVNTPWRCVAGAIYNVQIAGYPTVGFISNPVDPDA